MKDETIKRSRPYLQYAILGLVLLLVWVFQSAPENLFMIAAIRPVPMVVFVACVAIVYGEMTGGVFGLVAGMLMDLYTSPSVAFHVVLLTALGMFCGLAVKHLFMNNLLSAAVLWFAVSLLYFVLYWLLFKVILGGGGGLIYLYRFSLPSTLYTGCFGVVFYPLVRLIHSYL